jgi:UDP-2,4-diacetamido-2,4,6-trideoxy-beta-L-altropyranose hydrolase
MQNRPQPPLILFRADASPRIGTGHIMRCLTLAEKLAQQGFAIGFVSTPETVATVPRLARSGYPIHTELPPSAELLVIDHYGLGDEYERTAAARVGHLMAIDDLPIRRHLCSLLLDQTYGRDAGEWRPLLPPEAVILVGAQYALLRPEFAKLRRAALTRRSGGPAKQILISLGGTDPDNVTGAILAALDGSGLDLAIDVVMGSRSPHLDRIRAQIDGKPVALHTDLDSLAPLMVQADLAIGAGGTTSWERCCLGLPTVVLEIADNQRDVISHLLKADAAIDGGPCKPLDPPDFRNRIGSIVLDSNRLAAVSANAARLCDGNGALRVAEAITSLLSSSSRNPT